MKPVAHICRICGYSAFPSRFRCRDCGSADWDEKSIDTARLLAWTTTSDGTIIADLDADGIAVVGRLIIESPAALPDCGDRVPVTADPEADIALSASPVIAFVPDTQR